MKHHLVLRDDPPTRLLLDAIESRMTELDDRAGLFFDDPRSEDVDGTMLYTFPELAAGLTTLQLVDDSHGTGRHLAIYGPNADEIAEVLSQVLPVVAPEELERIAKVSRAPRDLLRAAIAQGPNPSASAIDLIRAGLLADEVATVEAAITAAAMSESQVFLTHLERLAASHDHPSIQVQAEQALKVRQK